MVLFPLSLALLWDFYDLKWFLLLIEIDSIQHKVSFILSDLLALFCSTPVGLERCQPECMTFLILRLLIRQLISGSRGRSSGSISASLATEGNCYFRNSGTWPVTIGCHGNKDRHSQRADQLASICEVHETCHSDTFIVLVNSHQRWKQTRNRVCFHHWRELTLALWCHSIVWSLFSWNKM